jgi:hypothetical protein
MFGAVIVMFGLVWGCSGSWHLLYQCCICYTGLYQSPIWANKWYQSTGSMVRWCGIVIWCDSNLNKNMANFIVASVFGIEKFDRK